MGGISGKIQCIIDIGSWVSWPVFVTLKQRLAMKTKGFLFVYWDNWDNWNWESVGEMLTAPWGGAWQCSSDVMSRIVTVKVVFVNNSLLCPAPLFGFKSLIDVAGGVGATLFAKSNNRTRTVIACHKTNLWDNQSPHHHTLKSPTKKISFMTHGRPQPAHI